MIEPQAAVPLEWEIAPDRKVTLDQPTIIGVLNVTPDSFSDGGAHLDPARAVARGLEMIEEGAAAIDIGGESTRPGARQLPANTQIMRVIPVIRRLRAQTEAIISIDTTLAAVARAALDAGADIINDVSACLDDEAMAGLAAERQCGLILMHRLRAPADDSFSDAYAGGEPAYEGGVIAAVSRFLGERVAAVSAAGVQHQRMVIDPGLGFGKTVEQNFELIARSRELGELNGRRYPILSAASRKSFLGRAANVAQPQRRVASSVAVSVAHALAGVRLFRVHDVAAHREALAVAAAIGCASRECC